MKTELKNEWIALEEKYHTLLKEKVNQHNLRNNTSIPQPEITSQLIFCKDGIVINKHSEPLFKSGISVLVNNKTIVEVKEMKMLKTNSNENFYNYTEAYSLDEINFYQPEVVVEKDLINIFQKISA